MSLMRVSISWNRSRALSQRFPRVSKTEGSPVQILPCRKGVKGLSDLKQGLTSQQLHHPRPQSISYRLPKLPASLRSGVEVHPYVFKEPYNEAQFLLQKDPIPRPALPITLTSSSNVLMKSRIELRQTAPPNVTRSHLSRSGPRKHDFHPQWRNISCGTVLPALEVNQTRWKEPRTPPQSVVDSSVMPTVEVRTKTPVQPTTTATENGQIKCPTVLLHNSEGERKLTWQLSPYDNKNFDKQGLGPNQGPFSRELPKKCMPPANWLRMKLRHRIHERKPEHRESLAMA